MTTRATNWCFTIHNYSQKDLDRLKYVSENLETVKVRGIGFQEEIAPTTGAKHIQGFIRMKRDTRMGGIKKILEREDAHLEIMRGKVSQNIAYVTKNESAIDNGQRIVAGDMTESQGKRSDLESLATKIRNREISITQIMEEYPQLYCQYKNGLKDMCDAAYGTPRTDKSHVTVMYGASGTGKSMEAFKSEDIYVLRCSKSGVWFDGYNYNKTLVIDDFYGWIPFNMLLNLLDRYSMKVDIKGGAMEFNSPKIIITSNSSPLNWYKNLSIEHQIALLRRLDCVQCFSRKHGIVDVTEAVKSKINELAKYSDDEEEDELLDMTMEKPVYNVTNSIVFQSGGGEEVPQGNTILEADGKGVSRSELPPIELPKLKRNVRISDLLTLGTDYTKVLKHKTNDKWWTLYNGFDPVYCGPISGSYDDLKKAIDWSKNNLDKVSS